MLVGIARLDGSVRIEQVSIYIDTEIDFVGNSLQTYGNYTPGTLNEELNHKSRRRESS